MWEFRLSPRDNPRQRTYLHIHRSGKKSPHTLYIPCRCLVFVSSEIVELYYFVGVCQDTVRPSRSALSIRADRQTIRFDDAQTVFVVSATGMRGELNIGLDRGSCSTRSPSGRVNLEDIPHSLRPQMEFGQSQSLCSVRLQQQSQSFVTARPSAKLGALCA